MSTILVNLACLDQLASRMECLLYEVEQSKGPPVWNRFPRLEPAWPDPLRQRVEAVDPSLLAKRRAQASAPAPRRAPSSSDPKRAAHYVARLQRNWDDFGRQDPMYWILTDPAKKGNRWDPEEFFRTGVTDINAALNQVRSAGLQIRMGRALDFGCGLGRLTQALAQQFQEAHGVDISPSMIAKAQTLNRYPNRCFYHQNGEPDLRIFEDNSFDFIYSIIVLQHIHPNISKRYISEFMRVLRPGGVAVFQVPSELARRDLSVPSELERAAAPDAATANALLSASVNDRPAWGHGSDRHGAG